MRRHLHRTGSATGLDHLPHHRVQFRRLRRCSRGCKLLSPGSIRNRAQQSATRSRRLENRRHKIAGRCLAVGPCDAHDAHLPARMTEVRRREPSQRLPRVRHDDPWHATVAHLRTLVVVSDDGDRAGCNRLVREVRTIHLESPKRHKHPAWLHSPRIVGHAAARFVEGAGIVTPQRPLVRR